VRARGVSAPTYDDIASTYDDVFVPHVFAQPAADLVVALDIPEGGAVLDVGSGTGAVSVPAQKAVGNGGMVVALDLSSRMLQIQEKKGLGNLLVGTTPGLPFPDETFDRILGSFVISHFADYKTALRDLARVLRSKGMLGVSAWARGETDYLRTWKEMLDSHFDMSDIEEAVARSIPWEEWFSKSQNLEQSLLEAGLEAARVEKREYPVQMRTEDYVLMRLSAMTGRILRQREPEATWNRFAEDVGRVFQEQYGERVAYVGSALLAVAAKP
jgi:ubiquinone/menaquinone biosynthesis C-methylase UbiE